MKTIVVALTVLSVILTVLACTKPTQPTAEEAAADVEARAKRFDAEYARMSLERAAKEAKAKKERDEEEARVKKEQDLWKKNNPNWRKEVEAAKAHLKANREAEEGARIWAACASIYEDTSGKRIRDLTMIQLRQVRACQALGKYPPPAY